MDNREIAKKLEREVFPELASLNNAARKILDKRIIGDKCLTDADEIQPLLMEYQRITHNHNVMTRKHNEFFDANPITERHLELYKECIFTTIKAMRDFNRRLDENQEIFLKYDVPRLHSFGSLEAFVKALRAFMRVWREETERGRERGEKSLIDWLQRLDQSDDAEKRTTLEEMRLVAVDLGLHISYPLALYFMFMAVSAESCEEIIGKIQEVHTVIQSLRVDENSAVIERFLAVVKYVDEALNEFWFAKKKKKKKKEENGVSPRESVASDLLHLMLREVLRFEVAFCCPDLPMMLTNEVFQGMGNHLKDVFHKKLNNVRIKVDELGLELQHLVRHEDLERFTFTQQLLEEGLQIIWNKLKLKLKPTDSARPLFSDS